MAQFDALGTGLSGTRAAEIDQGLRAHMNKVYGTMSVGMFITFAVAWAIGSSPDLLSILRDPQTLSPNILGYIVMFAPLAFVFGLSAGISRISAATAQIVFYAFAAVMGLSLSWIFAAFTGVSIATTFLATSVGFAGMSLYGYTTKRDLSGMGRFLMMGVIGLLVAMIANMFIGSGPLAMAISAIGVLIFAALTAYDTQKIKSDYVAHAAQGDAEWLGKSAIMGALMLYLDFINMFMFLLSFMGNRE